MSGQQHRQGLERIRSIAARSGTDINAMTRILDVVDEALAQPSATTGRPEQQQYPTREQIALVLARFDGYGYTTAEDLPEWRLDQADAVLAMFRQPSQECGVCGRQYPADDPRDTCPVCRPGFGEHGQRADTSAEHHDLCATRIPDMQIPGLEGVEQPCNCYLFAPVPPSIAEQPTPSAEPVTCPHWERGRITMRNGCTACAAEAAPPSIADMAPGTQFKREGYPGEMWTVKRDICDGGVYALSDGHRSQNAEDVDPSTIRDVQEPPLTPEAN